MGGQLWANTSSRVSQFHRIGVPKFYSKVNVFTVYNRYIAAGLTCGSDVGYPVIQVSSEDDPLNVGRRQGPYEVPYHTVISILTYWVARTGTHFRDNVYYK